MTETAEAQSQYAPQISETATQALSSVTESTPATNEPAWYLDDNTPGAGARPDWLPTKYKKASDVAKAYSELEKRLGAFTGAPDNYDLSSLELDQEQFVVKELTRVGKELNMSQDGLQKILGTLASAYETESEMHLTEQVKKLGQDGERRLTAFKNWTNDYLKPEEREIVSEWVKTAEDLQTIERIMAHTTMTDVPTTQSMNMANNFETVSELKAEMVTNISRFDSDAAYRKDWQKRMEAAHRRNPDG